jgi:hypothetical protein
VGSQGFQRERHASGRHGDQFEISCGSSAIHV